MHSLMHRGPLRSAMRPCGMQDLPHLAAATAGKAPLHHGDRPTSQGRARSPAPPVPNRA